jgi:hypothetical protein
VVTSRVLPAARFVYQHSSTIVTSPSVQGQAMDKGQGQQGQQGGGSKGSGSHPTPNDQRSDVHNPNSSVYQAAADNRSNQMNPNNSAYHASRSGSKK